MYMEYEIDVGKIYSAYLISQIPVINSSHFAAYLLKNKSNSVFHV